MPHTRKNIDCNKLSDLYIKKRFSLLKIGKILGYSSRTIEIKARECQIQLRNPGAIPPKVTDKTLKYLYLQKRMSSRKIAKIYKCAYSYIDTRIKSLDIPTRSLSSAHLDSKRVNFSENLYEKAYLIGFRIGDLRVRKMYKNSETILIDCGSTKPEQIKLIKKLFNKYGRVWISKPNKDKKTQIECGLNDSFLFLFNKPDKFPGWTLQKKDLILAIIAGFVDAEGSFYITHGKSMATFSIGNYNKTILKQIKDWLDSENCKSHIFKGVKKGYVGKDGYSHNNDYWILTIRKKKDILRFTEKILPHLKHRDRIKMAKSVVKNINKRNLKYGFIGM